MLHCPNCQHELAKYDYKGVMLDECGNCHGIWFDRDELRKAKDRTDADLRWLDFDLFDEEGNKFLVKPGKRICPKDGASMETLTYEHSGVALDRCNECKSVWLDNREFEKIIAYLEKAVVTKSASEYGKDAVREFSELFSGPEDTVSELKDFLSVANFFSIRVGVENPWMIRVAEFINLYWPIR